MNHITIDFDNIFTYSDMFAVLLLLILGTYLYSLKGWFPWFPPYAIFLFSFITIIHLIISELKKGKGRIIPETVTASLKTHVAGWIWLLWLIYGTLFINIPVIVSGNIIAIIQSVLYLFLAVITNISLLSQSAKVLTSFVLLIVSFSIFIHPNSLSSDLSTWILFIKVILFYIIFLLSNLIVEMELRRNHNTHGKISIQDCKQCQQNDNAENDVRKIELCFIQSIWILMTYNYLLFFVVFQLGYFIWSIFSLRKKHSSDLQRPEKRNSELLALESIKQQQTTPTITKKKQKPPSRSPATLPQVEIEIPEPTPLPSPPPRSPTPPPPPTPTPVIKPQTVLSLTDSELEAVFNNSHGNKSTTSKKSR